MTTDVFRRVRSTHGIHDNDAKASAVFEFWCGRALRGFWEKDWDSWDSWDSWFWTGSPGEKEDWPWRASSAVGMR